MTHPEFASRPNTTALNRQTIDDEDEDHGTEVSSVVAAPNNGVGIVGVYPRRGAPRVGREPVRLPQRGRRHPGHLRGRPLRAGRHQPELRRRGRRSAARRRDSVRVPSGSLIVAAAGNDGSTGSPPNYPAFYPHVLTVGATNEATASPPSRRSRRPSTSRLPACISRSPSRCREEPAGYVSRERHELSVAARRRRCGLGLDDAPRPRQHTALRAHAPLGDRHRRAGLRQRIGLRAAEHPEGARRSGRRRATRRSRTSSRARSSRTGCSRAGDAAADDAGPSCRVDQRPRRPQRGSRSTCTACGRRRSGRCARASRARSGPAPRARRTERAPARDREERRRRVSQPPAQAGTSTSRFARRRGSPNTQLRTHGRSQVTAVHSGPGDRRACGRARAPARPASASMSASATVGGERSRAAGSSRASLTVAHDVAHLPVVDRRLDRVLLRLGDLQPARRRGTSGRRAARRRSTPWRPKTSSPCTSTIIRHDRRCDRQRLDVLAHVVRAEDRRAALVGGDRGGDARGERTRSSPSGHRAIRPSELLREKPTRTGRPSDVRTSSRRTSSKFCSTVLPKPMPGSRADAAPRRSLRRRRSAVAPRGTRPLPTRRRRRSGSACIVRGSPCMCIRQRYAPDSRDDLRHLWIAAESGDVVDELRAELERAARDLGLRGVDRDRRAVQRLEDGHDAAQLLVDGDALGAGPRRLAADVEDRSALVEHPPARCGGSRRLEVDAAVREGVGRDVDDAHHGRPRESFLDRRTLV